MKNNSNNVRLTQMVTSAGCAAKIFPHILSDALKGVNWPTNENVLVGFEGKDDAGVYKINDELAH
jgi:selenide,water dikinase